MCQLLVARISTSVLTYIQFKFTQAACVSTSSACVCNRSQWMVSSSFRCPCSVFGLQLSTCCRQQITLLSAFSHSRTGQWFFLILSYSNVRYAQHVWCHWLGQYTAVIVNFTMLLKGRGVLCYCAAHRLSRSPRVYQSLLSRSLDGHRSRSLNYISELNPGRTKPSGPRPGKTYRLSTVGSFP